MNEYEIVKGTNYYLVYKDGKLVQWCDTEQEAKNYVKNEAVKDKKMSRKEKTHE